MAELPDGAQTADGGEGDAAEDQTTQPVEAGADATVEPAEGAAEASTEQETGTGPTEAGPAEAGVVVEEGGAPEAGPAEAAAPEAGAEEAGAPEAGVVDAAVDTGAAESGVAEAGSDATVSDSGSVDSGHADASHEEAGAEAGAPVACTTAAQTDCVQCSGNASGVCSATEALIVGLDIAKSQLTGGQVPLTGNSCYACLVNSGCLDDTINQDSDHECGNLPGNVATGSEASETQTEACLATLSCVISSGCQNAEEQNPGATDGISNCFCGAAEKSTTACGAASQSAVNGSCATQEVDGFGATSSTSNSTILGEFTTTDTASGMANAIFQCAGRNARRNAANRATSRLRPAPRD